MSIRNQIPNFLTLGNLACGVLAMVVLFDPGLVSPEKVPGTIALLMGIAMACDFLDGFVARALKVASDLGKQLDSLSDMVTFGVLPGLLMYTVLLPLVEVRWLAFVAFSIPLFSAYRLAKFNIDERQSDVFYGLPTPANAFFFLSLYLIFHWEVALHPESPWGFLYHPYVLAGICLGFSVLLVTDLPLLALKFKSFALKPNLARYIFLGISLILLLLLRYQAIPLVIAVYFALSVADQLFLKKT